MSNKSEAQEAGRDSYHSGKNCPQGHVDPVRYTSTGGCKVCTESHFKNIPRAPIEQTDEGLKKQYGRLTIGSIKWKDERPKHVIYDDVVITDEEKDAADFNEMINQIERIRGW